MSEFFGPWNRLRYLHGKRVSTYVVFRLQKLLLEPILFVSRGPAV